MNAKAGEFSCSTSDTACLCKNVNYGYGVRDCSSAYCDAVQVPNAGKYAYELCPNLGSGGAPAASGSAVSSFLGK